MSDVDESDAELLLERGQYVLHLLAQAQVQGTQGLVQ